MILAQGILISTLEEYHHQKFTKRARSISARPISGNLIKFVTNAGHEYTTWNIRSEIMHLCLLGCLMNSVWTGFIWKGIQDNVSRKSLKTRNYCGLRECDVFRYITHFDDPDALRSIIQSTKVTLQTAVMTKTPVPTPKTVVAIWWWFVGQIRLHDWRLLRLFLKLLAVPAQLYVQIVACITLAAVHSHCSAFHSTVLITQKYRIHVNLPSNLV